MRKLIFPILFVLMIFGCREEDPAPFYEVIPVVEVTNALFNDVEEIMLRTKLEVDGDSVVQTWAVKFKGVRYGCNMLKWYGSPVEYQAPAFLRFTVLVYYDLEGDSGNGYTLLDNYSSDNLIKQATWIRAFFEVRDRNNPSDRYVGIEQWNSPSDGTWQAPTVEWQVGDFNNVPGNVASPNSSARIAGVEIPKECECEWILIE